MHNGHTTIRRSLAFVFAAVLVLGVVACGDEQESGSPDFATADLAGLNLGPDDLPRMDFQADVSGPGAFAAQQEEQAKEEGDEGGVELVARLEEIGLEADYVSQFFAASRDGDPLFAESVAFLFKGEAAAEQAAPVVTEANAESLEKGEEIESPDLGEQAFGARGKFDGYLTYAFGWRVGNAIQVVTVAPGDQDAGPEDTIELAEQLEARAQR